MIAKTKTKQKPLNYLTPDASFIAFFLPNPSPKNPRQGHELWPAWAIPIDPSSATKALGLVRPATGESFEVSSCSKVLG